MKVTAAGPHLFQLTTFLGLINCYLVRESDGFTLIDTGLNDRRLGIVRQARKRGLPIVRVLLTHAHLDHVGALDTLQKALPQVPIAISERDARFLAGDQSLNASKP